MRILVASPDSVAPAVAFTSPAAGNVSGTITISANASDNYAVAGVQFKMDGNNIGAEDTSAPFSVTYDTHLLANGGHTITAVARDAAGNTSTATLNINVANTAPAAGIVWLNDMLVWDDGDGAYESGRYGPEPYDGTGGNWIWQATGQKFTPVYLPGNPDPTHYQMRVWMHGERVEGGSDGNQVYIDFQVAGIVGWTTVWQNGPTWSFNLGPLWNVNGGEACYAKRWCSNPGWNTCFCQGIGFYYDFVVKGGYQS